MSNPTMNLRATMIALMLAGMAAGAGHRRRDRSGHHVIAGSRDHRVLARSVARRGQVRGAVRHGGRLARKRRRARDRIAQRFHRDAHVHVDRGRWHNDDDNGRRSHRRRNRWAGATSRIRWRWRRSRSISKALPIRPARELQRGAEWRQPSRPRTAGRVDIRRRPPATRGWDGIRPHRTKLRYDDGGRESRYQSPCDASCDDDHCCRAEELAEHHGAEGSIGARRGGRSWCHDDSGDRGGCRPRRQGAHYWSRAAAGRGVTTAAGPRQVPAKAPGAHYCARRGGRSWCHDGSGDRGRRRPRRQGAHYCARRGGRSWCHDGSGDRGRCRPRRQGAHYCGRRNQSRQPARHCER